jgi:hypothetical protein
MDWVDAACPVCGCALVAEPGEQQTVIDRHTRSVHVPRNLDGRSYPRDAVLTVGKGKTQYRLGDRSAWAGQTSLIAIITGTRKNADTDTVAWDGETFWIRSDFRRLVYRELAELKGTHQ